METLTLPGKLDSLSAIGQFVKDTATRAGLGSRAGYNLRLAIDEIATNVVLHGYEGAGLSGDLTISREITGNWVIIILEDTAIAYDPHSAILPSEEELTKPLEDRPIGGLGLYLTVNAVDHFDYERSEGRNRNKFFVRRPIDF